MTSQFTKIRLLATLTAALALSGCAVGPDYLRPDAWLPDMFRSKPAAETPVARAENPAVNAEWWRLFNDPALDALVQQALDNGGHDNVTALCIQVFGPGHISLRARLAALRCRMQGRGA